MMYIYETLIAEQELVQGPVEDWTIEDKVEAQAAILRDVIHQIQRIETSMNARLDILEARVTHLYSIASWTAPPGSHREGPYLEGEVPIPVSRPTGFDAYNLTDALIYIREAGTAGVFANKVRDRFRFMRKAISDGNPLPSELANAGVTLRKVGKGWRYSIPSLG